jgi:hypothetical protein
MKKFFIIVILLGSMAVSSYFVLTLLRSSRREAGAPTRASRVVTVEKGKNPPLTAGEVDISTFSTLPITAEKTVELDNGIKFKFGYFEGVGDRQYSFGRGGSGSPISSGKMANADLFRVAATFFDVKPRYVTNAPEAEDRKISMEYEYPANLPRGEVGKALLEVFGLGATVGEREVEALYVSPRGQLKSLAHEQGAQTSVSVRSEGKAMVFKFGNYPVIEALETLLGSSDVELVFAEEIKDARVSFEIPTSSAQDLLDRLGDMLNVSYAPTKKRVKTLYIYKQ